MWCCPPKCSVQLTMPQSVLKLFKILTLGRIISTPCKKASHDLCKTFQDAYSQLFWECRELQTCEAVPLASQLSSQGKRKFAENEQPGALTCSTRHANLPFRRTSLSLWAGIAQGLQKRSETVRAMNMWLGCGEET